MIWLGLLIFVAGVVFGVGSHNAYVSTQQELAKHNHKREMDEIFAEVKRLRAQVAGLIGTK